MLMLVMWSRSLRSLTLLCLIMSSEGSEPLVALQYSLDLIRSNVGVVVNKKFKIKNRHEKLEIFHRRFCLKPEVCWWRMCRNSFGNFSFYLSMFNSSILGFQIEICRLHCLRIRYQKTQRIMEQLGIS
jgi:hypothetical protein